MAAAELRVIEDPVPTYQMLMRPVLNALAALGSSGSNKEIYDKVVEQQNYSEEIQNILLPSGNWTKLWDRCGWARSYLNMVGALSNSGNGTWSMTPEGEMLSNAEISKRIKAKLREGAQARLQQQSASPREVATSLNAQTAHEAAEEAATVEEAVGNDRGWKDELLSVLTGIAPDAFERLCQRLLHESGFTKVQVTGKTGDGGIDGIGVLKINLLSFTVFFQCKRYKGSVGSALSAIFAAR